MEDKRIARAQELYWQIQRDRESGIESGRDKLAEMAALHQEIATERITAGNSDGWIDLYAAIAAWGRASDFPKAEHCIRWGHEIARQLSPGHENIAEELQRLEDWIVNLDKQSASGGSLRRNDDQRVMGRPRTDDVRNSNSSEAERAPLFFRLHPIESLGLYHVLPGTRAASIRIGTPTDVAPRSNEARLASLDLAVVIEHVYRAKCSSVVFDDVRQRDMGFVANALETVRKETGSLGIIRSSSVIAQGSIGFPLQSIDAASMSILTLHEKTARQFSSPSPQELRESLCRMRENGVWLEVTTTLVPAVNDSENELLEIALSLRAIDKAIPWHIRHAEQYRGVDARWTSVAAERAISAGARAGLDYVYCSESGPDRELTFCSTCRDVVLVERFEGHPRLFVTDGNRCPRCRASLRGIISVADINISVPTM